MSGSTNSNSEVAPVEPLFRDRYQTEFMRVTQKEDKDAPLRHPGSPTSPMLPRHPGSPTSPMVQPRSKGTGWCATKVPVAAPAKLYSPPAAAAVDDVLACPVCKIDYDTVMKRPILLPGCGHTLCSVCVRERSVSTLECPTCRRSYPGASVDSLPVNISLEALLVNKYGLATLQRIIIEQSGEKKPNGNCSAHGIRLSFWCRTCEEVACGECLFDKHPSDGHTLAKLQDVAAEIRETALKTITSCHDDATKIFSNHLKAFVELLESLHEAGKLVQDSRKLVAAAQCAEDFSSVSSVREAIMDTNRKVEQLKLEELECDGDDSSRSATLGKPAAVDVPAAGTTTLTDEATTSSAVDDISAAFDAINAAVDSMAIGCEEHKAAEVAVVKETIKTKPAKVVKKLKKVRTPGDHGQVFAMHTDGRLAQVQTESQGLHIYSLAQYPSTGYSVAVRLGLLMEFIQREHPVVFLDFSLGEQRLGRVYLQLRGDMRRSLQFMHLCLGTMGPTYKGSRVDGICEKGAPGEYLRLGDYTGQGGQGGVGLIDGLEWGSQWSASKKSGQVCGVGGDAGEKRFGALFVLCTRDNPKDQFRCPFGSVIDGMEVLHKLAKTEPLEAVYISDCGALIPIE